MHRISPTNPVRRRLFDDLTDESRIDNLANYIQETAKRDRAEKMKKWNFDFENEIPLEGAYEWFRCDGNTDWTGVKSDTKIDEDEPEEGDSFLPMKRDNEATPKVGTNNESVPLLRKRRTEDKASNDKGVRRRISFD